LKEGSAGEQRRRSPHKTVHLGAHGATALEIKNSGAGKPVKGPANSVSQVALQLAELSLAVQRLNRVLDRAIDRLSKRNAQL
jgi:hypothetical protein